MKTLLRTQIQIQILQAKIDFFILSIHVFGFWGRSFVFWSRSSRIGQIFKFWSRLISSWLGKYILELGFGSSLSWFEDKLLLFDISRSFMYGDVRYSFICGASALMFRYSRGQKKFFRLQKDLLSLVGRTGLSLDRMYVEIDSRVLLIFQKGFWVWNSVFLVSKQFYQFW